MEKVPVAAGVAPMASEIWPSEVGLVNVTVMPVTVPLHMPVPGGQEPQRELMGAVVEQEA